MSKRMLKRLSGCSRRSSNDKQISKKKVEAQQEQDELFSTQFNNLDNKKLFSLDFVCEKLDKMFLQLRTIPDIKKNKKTINLFYGRMINCELVAKYSVYTRLKWLVYHHEIISKYQMNAPLFPYILKAFQFYTQSLDQITAKFGHFQKYLVKIVFRPYLQYLSKLCFIKIIPDHEEGKERTPKKLKEKSSLQENKIDHEKFTKDADTLAQFKSNKQVCMFELHKVHNEGSQESKSSEDNDEKNIYENIEIQRKVKKKLKKNCSRWSSSQVSENQQDLQKNQKQDICVEVRIARWYRIYNFLQHTLDIFAGSLKQVNNFFKQEFPYLTKISSLIINDLNKWMFKLNYQYRVLKKLDITLMQIDQLVIKLRRFTQSNKIFEIQQNNYDQSKDLMQDGLLSPFKNFTDISPIKGQKSMQPSTSVSFQCV